MTAHIEGDFVVFITGMRINKLWKIHKWYPNFRAMRKILMSAFGNQEESGAIGAHAWWQLRGPLLIAYWRSVEHLERFANNPDAPHAQVWKDYFIRNRGGEVGVWHETFVVRDGEWEAVYDYMPKPVALAMCTEHIPVERKGNLAHERRAEGARLAAEKETAE